MRVLKKAIWSCSITLTVTKQKPISKQLRILTETLPLSEWRAISRGEHTTIYFKNEELLTWYVLANTNEDN
jgi:hypothetical protein